MNHSELLKVMQTLFLSAREGFNQNLNFIYLLDLVRNHFFAMLLWNSALTGKTTRR